MEEDEGHMWFFFFGQNSEIKVGILRKKSQNSEIKVGILRKKIGILRFNSEFWEKSQTSEIKVGILIFNSEFWDLSQNSEI